MLALVALQWRPVYTPVNAVTGIMYAIPSLALFVLLVPITGLTTLTAEIALVSYTLQILFRSIVAGVDGVPDSVRESAAGMGYTRRRQLWTHRAAARPAGDHERAADRHRHHGRPGAHRRLPRLRPGRARAS